MRATTSAEDTVLQATTRKVAVKVRVQNADGTWIELTDLSSVNWLDDVRWGETIDQPVPDADIRLHKFASDGDNLAPLDETSPLNVDDLSAYAALIDAGRQVDIQAATVAIDGTVTSGDYHTLFHGEIDVVEWGSEQVRVVARDRLMAHLVDRWIEDPTIYGTEAGRAVEDVIQDILDDWTDGRVNLWVPASPGFLVSPEYEQQQMSVLEALTQLAQLTGWDLRSRWREANSRFELKYFEPDRSASTTDWDFAVSDIFDIQNLDVDRDPIRNVVEVGYVDPDDERREVSVSDSDSISRFGRRWMRIEEGSDSPINTKAEATTFATAALSDLRSPDADQQTEQDFFWPIEVQDYVGFAADERWYSTDQQLAVYGFRHELSMDRHITRIMTRGKPAGQYLKWLPWGTDPSTPSEGLAITSLKEIGRTTTTVTYSWELGPLVKNVWVLRKDASQPVSSDPWPSAEDDLIDVLGRNTTQYTFDLPDPGDAAYVHLEPTDKNGRPGPVRKLIILPLADDPDRITAFAARIDDSDGSVEVRVGAPDTCQSYRYAYSVGAAPSWPSDAAVEAGTVRTISTVDAFTLAASTVGGKEWIVIRAAGYTNADGTGPDGTATDHGPIVDARDKRVTPIGSTDIEDAAVTVDKVTRQAQKFSTTVDFSASDYNTVAWGAGDINFGDGTTYTVDAGNTGDMAAGVTHWVYFDPDVSTTVLQVTTTRSDITGENRILMATCWPASNTGSGAGVVPAVGVLGVTDVNIAASSITTNMLQANVVTATKINVVSLSAISADMGTLTAGKVDVGSIEINADTERILFGAASDPTTGTGIFLGKDGTDYEFRAGDPSGDEIHWDGSSLLVGGTITADSFTGSNPVFSGSVDVQAALGVDAVTISGAAIGGHVEIIGRTPAPGVTGGSGFLESVDDGMRVRLSTGSFIELSGGGIIMPDLPTSDPTNAGELWNDSGTLKVSAG